MLKRELYKIREDGVKLYKTYSDEDFRIKQVETNIIYDEAIDVENATFTYVETEEKIEKVEIEEPKESEEKENGSN